MQPQSWPVSIPATDAWLEAVHDIVHHGLEVSPRGMPTKEIPQRTAYVEMVHPVMFFKPRKLNYKFMAAEAYWILSGDNRVETIAPYNKNISAFSDDGEVFAGAYGPPIENQLDYVVRTLVNDPDTRQAILTIWRQNPGPSKDIPCTVAADFKIRDGKLNAHVFMRSSDVWLGIPYDIFNFSMLAALVCGKVNEINHSCGEQLELGTLFLTAASSHLYARNLDDAMACLVKDQPDADDDYRLGETEAVPAELYQGIGAPGRLMNVLKALRESQPGDYLRWWEVRP